MQNKKFIGLIALVLSTLLLAGCLGGGVKDETVEQFFTRAGKSLSSLQAEPMVALMDFPLEIDVGKVQLPILNLNFRFTLDKDSVRTILENYIERNKQDSLGVKVEFAYDDSSITETQDEAVIEHLTLSISASRTLSEVFEPMLEPIFESKLRLELSDKDWEVAWSIIWPLIRTGLKTELGLDKARVEFEFTNVALKKVGKRWVFKEPALNLNLLNLGS